MAGLSMGGAESLLVGLNHLDDFAYVGGLQLRSIGRPEWFRIIFPGNHRTGSV